MRRASLLLLAAWLLCAQPQPGSIHGVVKDAVTGAPLPDFTIEVALPIPVNAATSAPARAGMRTNSAYTDESGRYVIAGLPAGSLTITARNPRRQTVTRRFQLNPGDNLPVDFVVPPNPTVSGRVIDADKRPVANAKVWVIQSDTSAGMVRHSLMGPQITQADGSYRFEYGLTAGREFHLLADHPPPATLVSRDPLPLDQREPIEAPTYYGDAITVENASPLVLRPGEQRDDTSIKIARAAHFCVDGTIGVFGRPSSHSFQISERALASTSLIRLHAVSAEDGTFRVCGLTAGEYVISTAVSADYLRAHQAPGPVQRELTGAADFVVAGSDVHHILLDVEKASLRVQTAWDGDPPPERDVTLSNGNRFAREGDSWVERDPAGREIKLSDQQRTTLFRTFIGNQASITLRAMFERASDLHTSGIPSDEAFGELSAGDYLVDAAGRPGCCYLKSMSYDGVPLTDRRIHLGPGSNGLLRIVFGANDATLVCNVIDAAGNPLSGTAVIVRTESGDALPIMPSGQPNGKSLRWDLPPGKYLVLAIDRPITSEEMEKISQFLSRATKVELTSKGTAQINLTAISID